MRLVNKTWDEIQVGDAADIRRLITKDDMMMFAAVSGNLNPMHLSGNALSGDDQSEIVAPGMLMASLISAVLGMKLPGPGTLYRRQVIDFHERVHAGEEVICRVEVKEVQRERMVKLHTSVRRAVDDALVLSGEAVVDAPTEKYDRDEVDAPGLIVQRHRHFEALIAHAKSLGAIPTAVVCPHDSNSLGGAMLADSHGIIQPVLVGRAATIRAVADEHEIDLTAIQIMEAPDDLSASALACSLVKDGQVSAIMKGHLHTDDLIKPMLDKTTGLRTGKRFTHVFVMDVPGQPEPILVSDAAINISPDLATKVSICQNAIDLAVSLGMDPRAGVLSAVETVNPAIQSSIDAALLSKMADRGQIRHGLVEGPLAMDNAVDLGAARTKGLKGKVAGRANILIVPNLDAGNMLAKQLAYISHAEGAGLLLGARVPVILNSRSDSPIARLASSAVASIHHASGAPS